MKKTKVLFNENYKPLMREIKEDFSPLQPEDGKISHVHGLVESTL
jgi:hypothetical protein